MSGPLGNVPNSRTHHNKRARNAQIKRQQEQLLLQQQQQQQHRLLFKQQHQPSKEANEPTPEALVVAEGETQIQPDTKSSLPPNILCLVNTLTPFIPAHNQGHCQFYSLGDLWEEFTEWSYYGVGVPTLLNEKELVTQYYVPYLSAIQLYIDPFLSDRIESGYSLQMSELSLNDELDYSNSRGKLIYEFFEREAPHKRMPLTDKALSLASLFPKLNTMKSYDLLPSSWICVAWYPICRNPMGSTLKNIETSFLTYHSLSTQSTSSKRSGKSSGIGDGKPVIPLPMFGVAYYKYKGSLLCPNKAQEGKKEDSLIQAAYDWIHDMNIHHPDFQFFQSHQRI